MVANTGSAQQPRFRAEAASFRVEWRRKGTKSSMEVRMRGLTMWTGVLMLSALAVKMPVSAEPSQPAPAAIDLAERLAAGKLKVVNREATPLQGDRRGVHVNEKPGNGIVWIEGSGFAEGTLEVAARARDVVGQGV